MKRALYSVLEKKQALPAKIRGKVNSGHRKPAGAAALRTPECERWPARMTAGRQEIA